MPRRGSKPSPKKKKRGGGKGRKISSRRAAGIAAVAFSVFIFVWACLGSWFVHHPKKWIERHSYGLQGVLAAPLVWIGDPVGDMTDALGITGHDAVYEYDVEAPEGSIAFAGYPRRSGPPAPSDIVVVNKGQFAVGWSPSLRHPVWCAYHVPREAPFEAGKRPSFVKDKTLATTPVSSTYDRSGYDRGHMVPNYAIATRFGPEMQRNTFLMSNIAPQTPALNRGVWREVEHRIADLWAARWGEIWVVVGSVPSSTGETIANSGVDVPEKFFQVIVAQEGMDVRAMALVYGQDVGWREWPTRGLVSIDELEEMTGLDFLPDLPEFIQNPLEAELPSRLWPIRKRDIFKKLAVRLK